MNILFIGDIIGKPGRKAIKNLLPTIIEQYNINLVIANCENAAGGFGVTHAIVDELLSYGIDVLTSGNHIWDKKEIQTFIESYRNLIRPANYPEKVKGFGSTLVLTKSREIVAVLNLIGRVFLKELDCPFRIAKKEISFLKKQSKIIIVDFHAEATSEKQALAYFLDGKVSAILGTHTHVQTADEQILPKGTGFITDVGMTGPFDSIIGTQKEIIIERFLTGIPSRLEIARENVFLQGVILKIDNINGICISIKRISLKLNRNY